MRERNSGMKGRRVVRVVKRERERERFEKEIKNE